MASDDIVPLKSRLGCRTCKIRRIKCGQERPDCLRCTSTGRQCEYQANPPNTFASTPSISSIIDHPLSSSPNTVWRERRAFAFYNERVATLLAGGLDVHFWSSVVPQVCRSVPAVWDAINAISLLFESPDPCQDPAFVAWSPEKIHDTSQNHRQALAWYSRSLSSIRMQIDRATLDLSVALVSCLLFICIESLQGRVEAGIQLLGQGMTLIRGRASGTAPTRTTAFIETSILPLFVRLGTVALTVLGRPIEGLSSMIEHNPEHATDSMEPVRIAHAALVAECLNFQHASSIHMAIAGDDSCVAEEYIMEAKNLKARLADWYRTHKKLLETSPVHLRSTAATFLAQHAAISMIVSTCLSRYETIYDAHLSDFQTILEQASLALDASAAPDGTQPPFTFETGVGLPLYVTVLKCRDQILRRKALALLRKAPAVQGFYKCTPEANYAEALMKLEEGLALGRSVELPDGIALTSPASLEMAMMIGLDKGDHRNTSRGITVCINAGTSPEYGYHSTKDQREEHPTDVPLLIPEAARVQARCLFRPRDNPGLVGLHDISKWKRGPGQLFLKFVRNHHDPSTNTWMAVEYIAPVDIV